MKKLMLFGVLALLKISPVNAESLVASVENTTVPAGEVFNLNLSFDGKNGGSMQPDLSVLQKDFSIYSTSSSSQISYINGQSSEQTDWDIGLMPKREGNFEIPAVSVGAFSSNPIKIKVLPAGTNVGAVTQKNNNVQNDNKLAEANKFGVELVADLQNPYVQQEINAVLTIKDKVGLQLTEEPTFVNAENWLVKVLKRPEIIQQNGERVIKFYYALFPQKSGQQEIPAVKVSGFYRGIDKAKNHPLLHQGASSLFQLMNVDFDEMFGTQIPVELYSKPISINVLPSLSQGNWWLPADAVNFKAFWNEKKPLFKVGETVARQIVILASGVAETQLPELEFSDNENFKIYPENPELETKTLNDKIVAQSVTRVVYIPQKGGEQILPEIKLNWFNVKTKKTETAVIPAEKVVVEGFAMQNEDANEQNTEAKLPEQNKNTPKLNEAEKENTIAKKLLADDKMEIIFIGGAFVLGMLFSLLLRRRSNSSSECIKNQNDNIEAILRKNLAEKDYKLLRDNLVLWGQKFFKSQNISNLNDISKIVANAEFNEELQKLNNILYGGKNETLDEKVILRTVKQVKNEKKRKTTGEPLPKLYK